MSHELPPLINSINRRDVETSSFDKSSKGEQKYARILEEYKEKGSKVPITTEFEFLDHTADVQLHSWGSNLKTSFENIVVAMFSYMTDLSLVHIDSYHVIKVKGQSKDIKSFLYHFMNEALFLFCGDRFIIKHIKILTFSLDDLELTALALGENWNKGRHSQGTEIKAITFSNIQIHNDLPTNDIYVVVDI